MPDGHSASSSRSPRILLRPLRASALATSVPQSASVVNRVTPEIRHRHLPNQPDPDRTPQPLAAGPDQPLRLAISARTVGPPVPIVLQKQGELHAEEKKRNNARSQGRVVVPKNRVVPSSSAGYNITQRSSSSLSNPHGNRQQDKQSMSWKARAGRMSGPDHYKFGDKARTLFFALLRPKELQRRNQIKKRMANGSRR